MERNNLSRAAIQSLLPSDISDGRWMTDSWKKHITGCTEKE